MAPIVAKDNKKEYSPAPEGLHQAVCVDVIDLGLQETQWGAKEKVEIRWQLDAMDPKSGRKFIVPKRYTLSLNEKATLRHHLEAWRGRKFSQTELEGFDLENLIGANCQIQIVHNISDDGRVWGNTQAVVPLGKGMQKIAAEEYIRVKDREKERGTAGGNGSDPEADSDIPF